MSLKTGACPEDCGYCPQSAHYETPVSGTPLVSPDDALAAARAAKEAGSTRFCMGAAWREVRSGPEFETVLEIVRGVRELGMEACCTLGMLDAEQARRLAEAGLTAYNHNLDTSREHYSRVITTRTYDDRLATLARVREAGISVCCGGILGMGESLDDRMALIATLASFDPHPESVPVNALVPVEGTPLAARPPLPALELVRAIATARVAMPLARIRLSAGRLTLSDEAQALAFLAGANSIFTGEKLLTTENPGRDRDHALLESLGLEPLAPAAS
jgi:biotin synthase